MNDRNSSGWVIPLVLAGLVCAGLWYYWSTIQAPQTAAPVSVESPEAIVGEQPSSPKFPLAPLTDVGEVPKLRPLPPLDQSDEYLLLELSDLFGDPLTNIISNARIIEKLVATVDNLPRLHLAEQIRPVGRLSGVFAADTAGDDRYAMTSESFRRFEPLVAILSNADTDDLTDLYRRYYPLLQTAYVELGYPNGYFNDRMIETIDDLLSAPVIQSELELIRPHVLYEFVDPDLESRSSGQKMMLRMGPDNAARVKVKLRAIRRIIAVAESVSD